MTYSLSASSTRSATSTRSPRPTSTSPTAATCRPRKSSRRRCAAIPERLAIRSKLLEVYAKRRDTKGFELLATQLFALTRGEGEDWAKAQELGSQIDPENPLYQAGRRAGASDARAPACVEPLGASTLPQSILPVPSQYGSSVGADSAIRDSQVGDLDLDLDNPDVGVPSQPARVRRHRSRIRREPATRPASSSRRPRCR